MSLIRGGGFEEHINFNFEPRGKRDFTPTWRADSPFPDRHIGIRLVLEEDAQELPPPAWNPTPHEVYEAVAWRMGWRPGQPPPRGAV